MDKTKSRKQELTKDSILDAISKGAKSLTQISKAHGHIGSVSSTVTAKIRKLVPDVADRMAGKADLEAAKQVTQSVTQVEAAKEAVKAPAVQVAQRKETYRGMYGAVFAEAVKVGEVAVREFIPQATQKIIANPAYAKAVGKIKAKVGDDGLVAGVTKAITFALGVMRSPRHTSNLGRSKDISEKRGTVHIVALEG